jgi:hypothetical protein
MPYRSTQTDADAALPRLAATKAKAALGPYAKTGGAFLLCWSDTEGPAEARVTVTAPVPDLALPHMGLGAARKLFNYGGPGEGAKFVLTVRGRPVAEVLVETFTLPAPT